MLQRKQLGLMSKSQNESIQEAIKRCNGLLKATISNENLFMLGLAWTETLSRRILHEFKLRCESGLPVSN